MNNRNDPYSAAMQIITGMMPMLMIDPDSNRRPGGRDDEFFRQLRDIGCRIGNDDDLADEADEAAKVRAVADAAASDAAAKYDAAAAVVEATTAKYDAAAKHNAQVAFDTANAHTVAAAAAAVDAEAELETAEVDLEVAEAELESASDELDAAQAAAYAARKVAAAKYDAAADELEADEADEAAKVRAVAGASAAVDAEANRRFNMMFPGYQRRDDDDVAEDVEVDEDDDVADKAYSDLVDANMSYDTAALTISVKLKNHGPGITDGLADDIEVFVDSLAEYFDEVEVLEINADIVTL